MEKEIGKIKKNDDTDIVIRIDEFGGYPGLTIREFVKNERYTGFTKAGVRIRPDAFEAFKTMINAIDPSDLKSSQPKPETKAEPKETDTDDAGIDEDGLM